MKIPSLLLNLLSVYTLWFIRQLQLLPTSKRWWQLLLLLT
jgi:hypothetical protein